MNIWNLLFCALLVAGILFTIGHAGMEAALEEQRTYCAMVKEGTWPDYKGTYAEVCNGQD